MTDCKRCGAAVASPYRAAASGPPYCGECWEYLIRQDAATARHLAGSLERLRGRWGRSHCATRLRHYSDFWEYPKNAAGHEDCGE